MANMNYLTLELSQATDSKVLSSNSAGSEKESSSVFSNLMEQNKAPIKGGNNVAKAGNEEHEQIKKNQNADKTQESDKDNSASNDSNIDSAGKNSTENSKSESQEVNNEKLSAETKNSNDTDVYNEAQLNKAEAAEAKNETSAELLLVSTSESDHTNLFTDPEQLLSFLNASEKVLSGKEGTTSEDAEKNPVTPVTPVTLGAGTDDQLLKTDKTLIAQSLSKQIDTEDSAIVNKVNELLKSKSTESASSLAKSGDDLLTNKENTSDKSIKSENIDNELSSDQQKLADIAKLAGATGVSSDLDKNVISTEKAVSALPSDITAKVNLQKITDKINNVVQLSGETIDVENDESTSLGSASDALKKIANEQAVTQLTDPQLSKVVIKADNKTTTLNNAEEIAKSLTENVLESAESEQLNIAKSDVKESLLNSINQAAFKTEQVSAKNKDAVQAIVTESTSNEAIKNSEETSETITEIGKDELLNAESKSVNNSLNNVKSNSTINPLIDTLSQREINDAVDGERYMQDEHSFDNVMQTLSADLAQTQKNTVIQQAETISIMRKDFTDAVKDKVMVMISQKLQQIDIQLDPPELGSMQVRINMQNEQAVVSFVVQNQQAKEALDQNMDRLKHMMAENGVDVGDANVKQESNQSAMNGENDQGSGGQAGNGEGDSLNGAMESEQVKVLKASSTGVDYYV